MKKPDNCCPECGGTTGFHYNCKAKFAQKWGEAEKKVLYFHESYSEFSCLDCDYIFTVKKPDTTVKKADSMKS